MQDHQPERAGSGGARLLRWVERLLLFAGAATLVWCALVVADATLAQRSARRSLEAAAIIDGPARPPEPRAADVPPVQSAEPALDIAPAARKGSAIATLSIPRIRLSAAVLRGSDAQTLRRGPGHLENTPAPGERGNAVIAGHRDSFFRPLHDIRPGDDIFVATSQGRFHYRVTWLRVVGPRDLTVLEPTDAPTLTLITCFPFWVLGPAPDRFVVRATRVQEPGHGPSEPPVSPPFEAISPQAPATPAAGEPVGGTDPPPPDDETAVRRTIEQFRLTYNARLVSHDDQRAEGPLTFETCAITIDADQAGAACGAARVAEAEPRVWALTLKRTGGGWAIESIQSP